VNQLDRAQSSSLTPRGAGARLRVMTAHVYIEDLKDHVDSEVELRGWLYAKRSSGKVLFLELRDGSGIAQCVAVKSEVDEALFERARHLAQETSLSLHGVVRAHARKPGEYEVNVTALHVIAEPATEYPIGPKDHGVDFLMDHRHLWLRSRRQHAILRIRAEIIAAIRGYFDDHGFTLIDAPVFTPSACEGTSTLFQTDFHGEPVYLTQSGQL
jgi:asparaginyl-tRNA synthetase